MARNISTVIRRKTDKEDLFLAFAFQINFHTGHKNLACFREDSKKNRQKTDLSTKNRTTTGVDGYNAIMNETLSIPIQLILLELT